MATTSASPANARYWAWAQGFVLVGTLAFAATILRWPEPSMSLFWNVVLPLLPLSFLVTPVLWRSVCPLATLNMLGNQGGGLKLPGEVTRWAGLPSMVALVLLVPARHVAFNSNPWALAGLIVVAAGAALSLGRRYDARAGFCNLLCPVLPVERLYGQHPLSDLGNPRCTACSVCTPRGCPDLSLEKALPQLMGPHRKTRAWLGTATGAFACGFPGFIVAYFTVPAWAHASLGMVYVWVGSGMLLGGAVCAAACAMAAARSTVALPVLAALSAAAYFWFAARGSVTTLGVTAPGALWAARALLLAGIALWLARALQQARGDFVHLAARRR